MRFLSIPLSLILFATTATAVNFECFYSSEDFPSYGFAYSCAVTNGFINKSSDVEIKSINGAHLTHNGTDDAVIGFLIFYKILHHFPKGVTDYFKNIEVVSVEYSRLQSIHKEDLWQFGNKLVDLGLEGNELKSLEKDLFIHNPNLKYISLISNKIQSISENVFDSLNGLHGINLIDNNCINYIYYGREIRDFVRSIKLKCNEDFPSNDIRIPTIVTEEEYNSHLVKLLRKKITELERKIAEMRREGVR